MRLIKVFGLAMLAAVAAMAFVGVGSASAQHALLGSILCHLDPGKASTEPCKGTELLPYTGLILTLSLPGIPDTFTSGFATVKCHGQFTGEITDAGGLEKHPLGWLTLAKWTNCTVNSAPCLFFGGTKSVTAQALELPWHVTLLGADPNGEDKLNIGTLHVKKPVGLFLIECKSGTKFHCIYTKESVLSETLAHTSTEPAEIHTDVTLDRVALDGSCSATGTWKALHELREEKVVHTHTGGAKLEGLTPKDLSVHLL